MRHGGAILLTVSAVLLFAAGGAALFAPEEVSASLGASTAHPSSIAIQLAGAGLLGSAVIDWMSRRNRIGGVYARPLALGNLLLFTCTGFSFGRGLADGRLPPLTAGPLCVVSAGLAVAFAWLIFFSDPVGLSSET